MGQSGRKGESMEWIPIFLGIAVGLSVYAAWGVKQNTETIKTILQIINQQSKNESELIDQIIEAGLYAASGRNHQGSIILAVTNKELRDRLSVLNQQIGGFPEGMDPFYGAPAVLVVLANKEAGTYLYDGSLVMGNLMNAAHSIGVDSCWIHRAKETFETAEGKELLKEWGLSEKYVGIGNCILGFAKGEYPKAKERKSDYIIKI